MANFKWLFIIAGLLVGVFTPWQIQVVIMMALLMGYIACFKPKLPNLQIVLESLFGGLATGLGLQFLVAFGSKNQVAAMIIAPLLLWLFLRMLFMGLETKYTLSPNAVVAQLQAEEDAGEHLEEKIDDQDGTNSKGTSAWSGDNSGQAAIPDASGRYMRYEFFATGEIAMGGPSYGDVIFNNGCALGGVGPSIVVSDDGNYAAMTLPSRNQWGLLIINLRDKLVYDLDNSSFWEIDRIENNIIYGRHSPITSNAAQQLSIADAIQTAKVQPLVHDDGWWVIDYPNREPFKHYKAVTIFSKLGTHKVTFVPDLKPFKNNPFLRSQHPIYTVLVDDELLGQDVGFPSAIWVDGQAKDSVQDGRFLLISSLIIDFKDAAFRDMTNGEFRIKNRKELAFVKGCDTNTNLSFEYGEFKDANDGFLLASGYVLPRSTDWENAEYNAYSCTSPWDEEKVSYWNIDKQKRIQSRTRIKRYFEYRIDLSQFSQTKNLKNCVTINLVNRGNANNSARLMYANQTNTHGGYSSYQLTTSCNISIENVIHEAIWSYCGRYLAVVRFEQPPLVPHKISIIDFKTATINTLANSYALPSFIWFDENALDFTHIIGVDENINFGPNSKHDESQQLRISQAKYAKNPYDLLIGAIDARRADAEKRAATKKSKVGYSGATVSQIAQHCILYAPNFEAPILQPPAGERA